MWPQPPPLLPFQQTGGPSYQAELAPEKGSSKQKFSIEEDNFLFYLVSVHGPSNWKRIASMMHGRTVRQCRERWKYYLKPSINRLEWTAQEDQLLLEKHGELGPQWAQLTPFFHVRTDIDLKNRFHKIQRSAKRMEKMALLKSQPNAHEAELSFLDVALTEDAPAGNPDPSDGERRNLFGQISSKGQNYVPKRIFCERLAERTPSNKVNPD
jgi:hypothetical protein